METRVWHQDVANRGMRRGAAIGALTGGLALTLEPFLTAQRYDGGSMFFQLGLFGALAGAVVGFFCALIPALVMAENTEFFLRHQALARLCVVSVALTLTLALTAIFFMVGNGDTTVGDYWRFVARFLAPLTGGMVLAAASTDYVLTSRKWRHDGGADPSESTPPHLAETEQPG